MEELLSNLPDDMREINEKISKGLIISDEEDSKLAKFLKSKAYFLTLQADHQEGQAQPPQTREKYGL